MNDPDAVHQEALAGGVTSPIASSLISDGIAVARAPDNESHGAERSRRLRRSILTGLFTRPLATVIALVSVPLFLKYLGGEGYGLYQAIIAFSAQLALTNAGLTSGLVNKLTDCHVSGDRDLARRYVSSLWFTLLLLVIVLCALAALVTPFVNWQKLFPTSDLGLRAQVPLVVWATATATFLTMLMGIPVSSYTAYQELDRNNYWDWAAKVTTLIGCIVVVRTRLGLIGVVLVMLALPAGVRLVNTVWMFAVEKPWLRPKIRLFDVKLLRSALREGVCIFVLQMAAVAIFQSDKIIVSSQLGAAQVTGFSILGVVFLQAYGLFALLLAPLWPAYGEAVRRGDIAWINRKLNISMAAGCAIMLTCGAIMFFAGDWVLSFLPGKVSVSKWLVVATTAMFVTRIFAECQSVVLNAASVLVPQMWILGANAALNIAIAILLARRIGVTGVVWSFPISAVLTSLWAYPWLIRRHITSRFQSP